MQIARQIRQQVTEASVRRGRLKRLIRQRVVQDMVLLTVTEPQLQSLSCFQCRCPAFDYVHVRGLSSRCLAYNVKSH